MKIGIFFGGQSKEREISFAGGRTVYDNLNKDLFEPVPIFVDSLGNFILLDWQYLYKGTIRDFYPPAQYQSADYQLYIESLAEDCGDNLGKISEDKINEIITHVGKCVYPHELSSMMDFAFLALHGGQGEDGAIQGILEWYNIPYSGSGILPSAIGINKNIQKDLLVQYGFARPKSMILTKNDYKKNAYKGDMLETLVAKIGLPMVIKAPNQGSSMGISILNEKDNHAFMQMINKAFFIQELSGKKWLNFSKKEKLQYLTSLTDIREGIGFPLTLEIVLQDLNGQRTPIKHLGVVFRPEVLEKLLDENVKENLHRIILTATSAEESILIERFIVGKEFSCIVVQDENENGINIPLALPPTQILKKTDFFDYRSKYLPGMTRKITPIDLPTAQIENIRRECEKLFVAINANVYARIDGFINALGEIFLNDPNTTSGMLPSSFFFHQAAEIGLNPSQFLTYIIRTSISERIKTPKNNFFLHQKLQSLDEKINNNQNKTTLKIKVAVIMGGYSTERHISVESGRNIFEKLASSTKYEPIPVFLMGNDIEQELYQIPVNMMLKDNADDIRDKILNYEAQSTSEGQILLEKIKIEAKNITQKYAQNAIFKPQKISYEWLKQNVNTVFIALHGRPGEDGAIQAKLNEIKLPYNGSGVESSQITINKYETNEILKNNGILVAKHTRLHKKNWKEDNLKFVFEQIEQEFPYPFIAKPVDDGCSSAVKKIKNREELGAFCEMMFRERSEFVPSAVQTLGLKANEEFPQKDAFLIEELISKNGAKYFLEITGGLLTKFTDENPNNKFTYEMFEPSETLAGGEVLSLEEKFLAGEGQNITPARYTGSFRDNQKDNIEQNLEKNQIISKQVRETLQKTAQILNVQGYARIDAFVRVYEDNKVETIIIEINSLPGMTPATCIFHQVALNGYKPYNFIDEILEFGEKRLAK